MTALPLSIVAQGEGNGFSIHMPRVIAFPDTWFTITNAVVAEWVIIAALLVIGLIINRVFLRGGKNALRSAMELLLDFLEDWYAPFIGGKKQARRFLPLLGSLFLFILFSNYLGLIPTVGYPGSLFAPTGRWGTTVGLALIVMVTCQYVAVKELGLTGWLNHLTHMFPLGLLEEFVRPFSLSLRLFGNIFGEEVLLAVIVFLAPQLVPVPIMVLSLLFGAIQAIVFTTLSASYIGGLLEHAESINNHTHHVDIRGGHSQSQTPAA